MTHERVTVYQARAQSGSSSVLDDIVSHLLQVVLGQTVLVYEGLGSHEEVICRVEGKLQHHLGLIYLDVQDEVILLPLVSSLALGLYRDSGPAQETEVKQKESFSKPGTSVSSNSL